MSDERLAEIEALVDGDAVFVFKDHMRWLIVEVEPLRVTESILRKIIQESTDDGDFRLEDRWLHVEANWVPLTAAEITVLAAGALSEEPTQP